MTKELRIFAGIQWGRFCAGRPSRGYRVDVPLDAEGWNLLVDQIKDAEGLGGEAQCPLAIAKDALPTMSFFEGPDWSLIGNAFEILITELPFSGDTAVTDPLFAEAKTAHYYQVTVPLDTRSWQLGVNVTRGDWSLAVRHGGLPNTRSKGFQRSE